MTQIYKTHHDFLTLKQSYDHNQRWDMYWDSYLSILLICRGLFTHTATSSTRVINEISPSFHYIFILQVDSTTCAILNFEIWCRMRCRRLFRMIDWFNSVFLLFIHFYLHWHGRNPDKRCNNVGKNQMFDGLLHRGNKKRCTIVIIWTLLCWA